MDFSQMLIGVAAVFFISNLFFSIFWMKNLFRTHQDKMSQEWEEQKNFQTQFLTQNYQLLENKISAFESRVQQNQLGLQSTLDQRWGEKMKEEFLFFEKMQKTLAQSEQHISALHQTHTQLGDSFSELNRVFRLPHLRGGMGEAILENILADALPMDQVFFQHAIAPGSTERVDAALLFGKHLLPIDSKFPREQVMGLFDYSTPQELEVARKTLQEVVKTQARSIAKKYIHPELGTTDMALIFFPNETLYFEVIRNLDLMETLNQIKVYPSSPNTLMVTLRSVQMAQEYYLLSKNSENTLKVIQKTRKHFETFQKRWDELGQSIRKTALLFDQGQSSLHQYESALPFQTQGTAPSDSVIIDPVEMPTRAPDSH